MADIDLVSDKDKLRLEKEKKITDRKDDDARTIMKFAGNRRVINEFLEWSKCHHGIFVAGDNGYTTTYNAGVKDAGLWWMNRILKAAPELYMQMREEFKMDLIQTEKEINKPQEN